jgi:hypothetical protein
MSNPTRPPTGAKNQVRRLAHGHDARMARACCEGVRRTGPPTTYHLAGPSLHRALSPGTRPSRNQSPPCPHESLLRVHALTCVVCVTAVFRRCVTAVLYGVCRRAHAPCIMRTRAMQDTRVQRPKAPRRSIPQHAVARQRAATRDASRSVGRGRGRSRSRTRRSRPDSAVETRGPPTTCLLPNLIRPTSNRSRKPREAAICLRASAHAISRAFAETIDSVVSPSADRGILRYSILSYDSLS